MNTYKKVLPLAVAMALAACGGGSDTVPDQSEGAVSLEDLGTYARFSPAVSDLPLNTDLLFAAAADSDGTADTGGSNPVSTAIRSLDGFSTNAPFDIAFSDGLSPGSPCTLFMVSQSEEPCQPNVFLVPLDTGENDPLDPTGIEGVNFTALEDTAVVASVVSQDGGENNVLRVTPVQPLLPKTKYLVVVTNNLQDAGGDPVQPSFHYELLRSADAETLAGLAGSLQGVSALIQQAWEPTADAVLNGLTEGSLGKENVVISYTFTTTDPVAPLLANAAPRAALMAQLVQAGVKAKIAEIVSMQMKTEDVQDQIMALVESGETLEAATAIVQEQVTEQVKETQGEAITAGVQEAVPPKISALDAALVDARGEGLSTPTAREVGMITMLPPGEGDIGPVDLGVDLGDFFEQLDSGVVNLYTGYIKLPYYLSTPETTAAASYTLDAWQPDQLLGAMLSASLPEGAPSVPPMDVDGGYNVTYRYPFAEPQSFESVPLQLTLPISEDCESPYQTAIYIHGITSDRTSVASLAHTLAGQCVATVAIDLPLHGASTDPSEVSYALNVENMTPPSDDEDDLPGLGLLLAQLYGADAPKERHFNDPAGSGGRFINLSALTNTRDNLRQSVMDLLNLNASLSAINDQLAPREVSLDTGNVSVVGASLGGIVGTTFTAVNQLAYAADGQLASIAMNPEFASDLNPLSSLAVSVGGSQLSYLLSTSDTFGPVITNGLAAAGVTPGTANFDRFLYVAQSTVSSGDPVNFAATLGTLGVPVLLQQINGDTVVPNGDATLPLMGTDGLSSLVGAVQLTPGAQDVSGTPGIVKMNAGGHGSLLTPSGGAPQVTAELQTQAVSFILSGGAQTAVGSVAPGDVEIPAP